MSARQRESVERSPSSDSRMTYTEFLRQFPNDDACLDYLKARYYADGTPCPKCEKPSRFHRIKGRSAYSCQFCGHHVYPTAGTIFHKSSTSLQLWFWAIYLIGSSKCGISAKQLGREIGVTYKTAHRMLKKIRLLMDEDGGPLSGDVEVDETFARGRLRASETRGKTGQERKRLMDEKSKGRTVLAAVERGGRVKASVVPDRSKPTLQGKIREFVLPESMIFTDELKLYVGIGREYKGHKRIKHKARIYVEGDAGTQNVESFFALFKNSVRGAHHSISTTYLPNYLDEYTFRWNHRKDEGSMFWTILDRVRKDRLAAG
ncbi:MAG: IS1595 family transposase [Actinomycetota bacterium]|nr:IS1595 family transposase [Actinomycetota bacterium]